MAFAYLDDHTLAEVRTAAIELNFAITDQTLIDVTHGIPPAFLGQAMVGGSTLAKLNALLQRMNTTRILVTGEEPLLRWLDNAIVLAAGRQQELVFRLALERASPDGTAPIAATVAGVAPVGIGPKDIDALPGSDGALEILIAEDDTLDVGFLHDGSAAARSVAKVLVHRHFNGAPQFVTGDAPDYGNGTGWLIAPNLLITNHHVVNARAPLEPAASQADFELQGAATLVQFDFHKAIPTLVEVNSIECEASDLTLDFALLRLAAGAGDRPPLRLRKTPMTKPKERALRERVNVLQHPKGDPMRLGFRDNFVVAGSDLRLSYLTDTAGGSSGSPICDDEWFVAGLHRGFATIKDAPVVVWGKTIRQENYGTPIGLILKYLEDNEPALHAEISAGQAALHT